MNLINPYLNGLDNDFVLGLFPMILHAYLMAQWLEHRVRRPATTGYDGGNAAG